MQTVDPELVERINITSSELKSERCKIASRLKFTKEKGKSNVFITAIKNYHVLIRPTQTNEKIFPLYSLKFVNSVWVECLGNLIPGGWTALYGI